MCLALPAEVVEVNGDHGTVDVGGVRMPVSLVLMDEVAAGDFVIVHVGYALSKIDPAEAASQLALMREAGLPGAGPAEAGLAEAMLAGEKELAA